MPSNLLEVFEPVDQGRRERLARFMVDLSGNCSMLHPRDVERSELEQAVRWLFVREEGGQFPRHQLTAWGMGYALSRTRQDDLVSQALAEPEGSVLAMVHMMDRDAVAAGRAMDERAAAAARRARTPGLTEAERRVAEIHNLYLTDGRTLDVLSQIIAELGIDPHAFSTWLASNVVALAARVPGTDVQGCLLLARDRSQHNATHRNDLKDFIFLKAAIPHGNIVVTENLWTHLARQEGLDRKYGTSVISDARELPEQLRLQECL